MILDALATSDRAVPTDDLLNVLNDAVGISRVPDLNTKLTLPWPRQDSWTPDLMDPIVARIRHQRAGQLALEQLARQGIAAPIRNVGGDKVSIPAQEGGTSGAYHMPVDVPALASGYSGVRHELPNHLLDIDLFTADLAVLDLNVRTLWCLREALASYRNGLYLSAANLLGAVSEGAWYAAGEQLRHMSDGLAKALDGDRTTQVISRLCEMMRRVGRLRADANELEAHAAYLRDLRNYGVHPRDLASSIHEAVFTEPSLAVLIMQTHRYLGRLGVTVAVLLQDDAQ